MTAAARAGVVVVSAATDESTAPAAAPERASSAYVASPWYDWLFFLLPPSIGVLIGAVLARTRADEIATEIDGRRVTWVALALGVLIHAHLGAVLFRSHGNVSIFRRHPIRFLVVPPALVVLLATWPAAMVVSTVVVVFWDVYHSALQTFGFARIYDRRAGNDGEAGRRLDLLLALVLYVGPILGGATLLTHVEKLADLEEVGLTFFRAVPAAAEAGRGTIARIVVAATLAAIAVYVAGYVRLARRGHRVSVQKVFLLATTGVCSIVAWGFNPWGLAFVIANFFHGVQYLALVWWSEGRRLGRATRLGRLAPLAFLVLVCGYGLFADLVQAEQRVLWALTQTIALLHFWYDGFVWSVKKRDV